MCRLEPNDPARYARQLSCLAETPLRRCLASTPCIRSTKPGSFIHPKTRLIGLIIKELLKALFALFPCDEPELLLLGNEIVFRHIPAELLHSLESVFGLFQDGGALLQENIGQLADAFTQLFFRHCLVD